MSEQYLLPIYSAVFSDKFNYGNFDKRMQMQKAIYLLEQMGLNIGNYGYVWYKYGPYSQQLQDDMYHADSKSYTNIEFSAKAKQDINALRDMIERRQDYDLPKWIECLASLHYLKENVLSSSATRERILVELKRRKSYLDSDRANEIAFDCISSI